MQIYIEKGPQELLEPEDKDSHKESGPRADQTKLGRFWALLGIRRTELITLLSKRMRGIRIEDSGLWRHVRDIGVS